MDLNLLHRVLFMIFMRSTGPISSSFHMTALSTIHLKNSRRRYTRHTACDFTYITLTSRLGDASSRRRFISYNCHDTCTVVEHVLSSTCGRG